MMSIVVPSRFVSQANDRPETLHSSDNLPGRHLGQESAPERPRVQVVDTVDWLPPWVNGGHSVTLAALTP